MTRRTDDIAAARYLDLISWFEGERNRERGWKAYAARTLGISPAYLGKLQKAAEASEVPRIGANVVARAVVRMRIQPSYFLVDDDQDVSAYRRESLAELVESLPETFRPEYMMDDFTVRLKEAVDAELARAAYLGSQDAAGSVGTRSDPQQADAGTVAHIVNALFHWDVRDQGRGEPEGLSHFRTSNASLELLPSELALLRVVGWAATAKGYQVTPGFYAASLALVRTLEMRGGQSSDTGHEERASKHVS